MLNSTMKLLLVVIVVLLSFAHASSDMKEVEVRTTLGDGDEVVESDVPLLPPPTELGARQLVWGEVLKLDDLGPIIINTGHT